MSEVKFDIFTFQLSPVTNQQLELFGDYISQEDLIKNKNIYLNNILKENLSFHSNRSLLNYKIEYEDDEFVLLRIANKKTITIERNFHKQSFDSEPSCLIAIYNNPSIQLLAI